MNVELINPFIVSLCHVLKMMANMDVKPGKPQIKKGNVSIKDIIATGYIGLVGEKAKGSLAVSFPKGTILGIAMRVFDEPIDEIDEEVEDLVGEITNIIVGNAKHPLAEKGYHFDQSIPTVIIGEDHVVYHNTRGPVLLLNFSTAAGDLVIEVCIK
jgi:chemotaxis protein CheX